MKVLNKYVSRTLGIESGDDVDPRWAIGYDTMSKFILKPMALSKVSQHIYKSYSKN